jgi:hypothetical protein
VGCLEGWPVGCLVGWPVGIVGLTVGGLGPPPGEVGAKVGACVGAKVGDCVGANDGTAVKEVGAKL